MKPYWTGKIRSKETKDKISKSLLGNIPWNKGKVGLQYHTDLWKQKYGFKAGQTPWNKGKKLTIEDKKKLSVRMKKIMSDKNIREKISKSKIDHIPWNKGKRNIYSKEIRQSMGKKNKGKKLSSSHKRKMRLSAIKRISEQKCNGGQIQPCFNLKACKFIEDYGKQHGYDFQHAMNGGEFYIKELGYFVDGYVKDKNTVFEYNESYHDRQKEKDVQRMVEIKQHLGCKFVQYDEKLDSIKIL